MVLAADRYFRHEEPTNAETAGQTGGPIMRQPMLRTVLICSFSLLTAACRTEETHAILVGRFADEETMLASIVIPALEDGEYPMYFALAQGETLCVLAGSIPDDNALFFKRCEGLSGKGSISCNNGRSSDVSWTLSSCHGGHGRSIGNLGPGFSFGFEQDKEKAVRQLRKAEQAR